MRLLSVLCALALSFTSVSAAIGNETFCRYYTNAVFQSYDRSKQLDLITAVVSRTLLGCGPLAGNPYSNGTCDPNANSIDRVVGLVETASNNRQFFDGTATYTSVTDNNAKNLPDIPAINSPRFVTFSNGSEGEEVALNPAGEALATHLVEWFGRDLGCDVANDTAPGVGIGTYKPTYTMTSVHATMQINKAVWTGFVNALVSTLKSYGVDDGDINTIIKPYAGKFLRAPAPSAFVICNQPDCDCANGYVASGSDCVLATSSSVLSSTGGAGVASTGGNGNPTPTPTPTPRPGSAVAVVASPVVMLVAAAGAALWL